MQSLRQRQRLKQRLQNEQSKKGTEDLPSGSRQRRDYSEPQSNNAEETEQSDSVAKHNSHSGVRCKTQDSLRVEVNINLLSNQYVKCDDLINPKSWSVSSRWLYTIIVASTGCLVSFASSIAAPTIPQAMKQYNIGEEVALLASATYFITFGLGTMIAAPLSEVFGRNPVYIMSMIAFALFTIGSALAPNIQTQATCRGFMGLFASTPLVTIGGSIGDLWPPLERTYVFPAFACCFFISSFIAPLIGDSVAVSPYVPWHFTEWINFAWACLIIVLFMLFMPETYSPVMLGWKSKFLSELALDKHESDPSLGNNLQSPLTAVELLRNMGRPVSMLLVEPILDLFALYLVLVWVVLFGFLPGYSYIFGQNGIYGLDQFHTGLCFLPIIVGFLVGLTPVGPIYRRFKRKLASAQESGNGRVPPEERVLLSMIGAPFLPIGIFWLGWAAQPSVSLWLSLVGGLFVSFATMLIFVSCIQYIIDAFENYTASALVGMTMTRYVVAGPMVIVSVPMYRNLGSRWALTLLGCLATVMTAVPYLFYFYGAKIRKTSRNTRHDI